VPTHGERRHLLEHAALARDLQVPQAIAPRNGDMVRLAPGEATIVDEVPSGRLYIDAGMVTEEDGHALKERRHAAANGVITVTVALDGRDRVVAGPAVKALGLPGDADFPLAEALEELTDEAGEALAALAPHLCAEDGAVESALARALKKAAFRIWERRPVVEATVLRV
jgi:ribonuclease J